MNIFTRIKNRIILLYYFRIVHKYEPRHPWNTLNRVRNVIKTKQKLQFLKLRINCKLAGLIITSQCDYPRATRIEFIWVNPTMYPPSSWESFQESGLYQSMYELFMQWHHLFVFPTPNNGLKEPKITIVLDISNKIQVERFRRILTLYGFYPDADITLRDLDFKKPWRECETIKNIVYSRYI
jgi:hypothetical protein